MTKMYQNMAGNIVIAISTKSSYWILTVFLIYGYIKILFFWRELDQNQYCFPTVDFSEHTPDRLF